MSIIRLKRINMHHQRSYPEIQNGSSAKKQINYEHL